MMIYPEIDNLAKLVDSRYTLAILCAKRAREIAFGNTIPLVKVKSTKPVTIAVNELYEGKISYGRNQAAAAMEQ